MPEYTINVVYEMSYHFYLEKASGIERIPDLILDDLGNGKIKVNLADAATFVLYVYGICKWFRDIYTNSDNKDTDTIRDALWELYKINFENDDADDEDEEAEFNFSDYQDYTYSEIEYEINGEAATITLTDTIDQSGRAFVGSVLESNEQTELREQYEAQAQFFDTVVPYHIVPRVVALGTVFFLEEFRNLGPFRIERKLFYDDFDVDAENVDCDIATPANRKYPIMTIPQNNVYCVTELFKWVVTYNKNTDPLTNGIIERVRIMNERDIEKKELEKYTREKALLQKERAEKNAKGTDRRDVRKLDYRIRELERMIVERKAEKIGRKTLNRLLELKF